MPFSALLDFAVEKLILNPSVRLDIRHCHNRWFVHSELVKLAGKGLSVKAQWSNGSSPCHVDYTLNAGHRFPEIYLGEAPVLETQCLLIDIQVRPFGSGEAQGQRYLSPREMSEVEQLAWQSGVAVDDAHWQELKTYAARILVESSELSRLGAGE